MFVLQIEGVACGGTLYTGVDYKPTITGLVGKIQFVIDVTDPSFNPYPGANFTQGSLVYNGAMIKNPALRGNSTLWNTYPYNCTVGCRLNYTFTNPEICMSRSQDQGSVLRLNKAGTMKLRLAWATGPLGGVKVVDQCTYTVASIQCAVGTNATTIGYVGG